MVNKVGMSCLTWQGLVIITVLNLEWMCRYVGMWFGKKERGGGISSLLYIYELKILTWDFIVILALFLFWQSCV